jgi:putative ABC transport system permease protein
MTALPIEPISRRPAHTSAAMVLRLALRDLRGGLSGFWIFLACIALGVTAITGVGSVADSLADGLAVQGRTILGGDVAFSRVATPLSSEEAAMIGAAGRTATVGSMRAMARRADGNATMIDVKAVDKAYPLTGTVGLDPVQSLGAALDAGSDGLFGIAADSTLSARLDAKVGDLLNIGNARFVLRATLRSEPDKLAGDIALGPRVLMSLDGLRAAGFEGPGSLVRWTTRVDLAKTGAAPIGDSGLERFVDAVKAAFPQAGWTIRTRHNISPEFDRNLKRFTQFLTLIGLTSLIIGGVGVANAVRATIERKRASLAILKSLGAPGGSVFAISLTQVILVAALGIGAGLIAGAALPFVLLALLGPIIPFPLDPSVYPLQLLQGALYGLLTTLAFSLGALGRAHDIPVSALFRDEIDPAPARLRRRYRLFIALAIGALIGTVFLFTPDWRLSAIYMGATVAAFGLLRLVAFALMRAVRALPHAHRMETRLALANIHRPGALTPSVVLSLGLGLALLVTLTLIDVNIRRQIADIGSGPAPSFFFIDIPSGQRDEFKQFVAAHAPGVTLAAVPMMRGRITALKDVPADQLKPKPGSAFALEGDRGITTSDTVPEGSTLASGRWWPMGYGGPPLVSFDKSLAEGLGLALGDKVSVNVLGRTITATIASFRSIEWNKLGINFFMVFSPNTFAGAPSSDLATATFPKNAGDAAEIALLKDVAGAYPTVTAIRVKDILETLTQQVTQLAVAIRGASGVAIAASVLVLAGALAAGRRARVYDAVVLKVLGATRRRLLAALLIEYGILGGATALFGILAGGAAAYGIVTRVMDFSFTFAWGPALVAAFAALVLTVLLGLAGTWRILGEKPASFLRSR